MKLTSIALVLASCSSIAGAAAARPYTPLDRSHKFPELSAKKMDETNALPEPALKLPKMTILLMKIRLLYLNRKSVLLELSLYAHLATEIQALHCRNRK